MHASLGRKHQCIQCSAKFYDLNQSPASCPKCGTQVITRLAPTSGPLNGSGTHAEPQAPGPKVRPKAEETEKLEGMGQVVELEELDDFDEDVEHLEEVEDHTEEPESDVNSDDADDEMFIEDLEESEAALFDERSEDDAGEEERETG